MRTDAGRAQEAGAVPDTWEAPIPLTEVEVPEFPTDALPDWMRDFVEAEATATQTPPDLAAFLVLAISGFACSKKVIVRVKPGHVEPLNLFAVVALPPANRKSAVFSDVAAPLAAAEAREVARRTPEIAEAQSRYRIDEDALRQVEQRAAKAGPGDVGGLREDARRRAEDLACWSPPVSPRYIVEDCSPEKLAMILRDQGGRVAVLAPEGDVFDLMAGRYSASGGPNFGVFLKGHAGDDLRVDRVGRSSDYVRAPALTVGLAVQPEVLRGLMQKQGFLGRGLLGRFLYAMPKSLLGRRAVDAPAVPDAVREGYHAGVTALLELPEATDEHGVVVPHVLTLDDGALAAFREFEARLEPQLGPFGELGHLSDWAGKLAGAIVRIVGILRLAEHPQVSEPGSLAIDQSTMERAIRIGRYLIPHARAAYGEMGGDPVIGEAIHLLGWVTSHGKLPFTKRDAFNATRSRFKKVPAMEPALNLLIEHGYLRIREDDSGPRPGRKPSPVYEVNPLSQNPHNAQNAGGDVESQTASQNAQNAHKPNGSTMNLEVLPQNAHNAHRTLDESGSADSADCAHVESGRNGDEPAGELFASLGPEAQLERPPVYAGGRRAGGPS